MIKTAAAADWPGLLGDRPAVELIKLSSRGLRGYDLSDFLKRAGHPIVLGLEKVAFHPGEAPVHLIALGATEAFGANRNGDGFSESTCRKYHKTFEKYARFYREHCNKPDSKSYGIIKLAVYNEPMRRVELIVALNGTKEAAERNKGYVADRELDKLASRQDVPVSMSARVPYDECTGCHNRAVTRADYCEDEAAGGFCKRGGLKRNIAKVSDDGHVLFADNPEVTWFDISSVHRPADRTAYTSGLLTV